MMNLFDRTRGGRRPRRSPRSVVRALAGTALPLLWAALLCSPLAAQTPDDAPIRELISKLDHGETEAVRKALPEFVAKYQNHPGVLFLQARVATDGIEAAKLYQSVIDNYPSSEWADDALFNLYQYYYAMGLYKTAELKMQQLRKEYPRSEYLEGKSVTGAPGNAADTGSATPPAAVAGAAAGQAADSGGTKGQGAGAGNAAPPKEANTVDPADSGAGSNPYTLQVGAFSTSENARKQKAWFEDRGYIAEITNRVRSGKSLYLVWVGSFPGTDEARKVLREIQSRYNITPIVVER